MATPTDDDGQQPNGTADGGPDIRLPPEQDRSAPACGNVPAKGSCNGDVAEYCDLERDELRRKDCGAMGKSCQIDLRGARCLSDGDEPTTDPVTGQPLTDGECGDLTYEGECSGNSIRYCLNGEVKLIDCTDTDMVCNLDGSWALCEFPASTEGCAGLTGDGECAGDTVRYCDTTTDTVLEYDCESADGEECRIEDDFADCYDVSAAPVEVDCSVVDANGICQGDVLKYCIGDTIYEDDCGARGKSCAEDAMLADFYSCF